MPDTNKALTLSRAATAMSMTSNMIKRITAVKTPDGEIDLKIGHRSATQSIGGA
jgi:hypothetical protein